MKQRTFNEFAGVYSLLLTPFNEDRSIDFLAYEKYVEWQAMQKPQNLFAVCGSSEMAQLSLEERLKTASLALKSSCGVPVFATANLEPSWLAQVEEVKKMEALGLNGLVFVTKGYGDNQERMYTYLAELSTYTTLPIVLYEFPGCSPAKMEAETYEKLIATGRFKGIKDTTCTMPDIEAKIAVQGTSNVMQANIPYLYDSYMAGARGVIATPTTCGAHLFVKMWNEFVAGDDESAKKTYESIILLDNAISNDFCASAKYLVSLQGIKMNWYTRGTHNIKPQRARALEAWYEWAKGYGIMQ